MTDEHLAKLDDAYKYRSDGDAKAVGDLIAEVRRLRAAEEERNELLTDVLLEHTTDESDGWRRGIGRSESRYAGERLVELGLAEAHPDNHTGSRVNRYRLRNEAVAVQG